MASVVKAVMGLPPKASIIIPSYNGGGKIHNLLEGLLKQSFRDFEIVVVLDGSTDNTHDVLELYREKFDEFKVITQINGGRSVARNNGARAAKSDLLIFYDDDIIPLSDSVEKHVNFQKGNCRILCGDQIEILSRLKTDVQNYKAWLSAKWTGKYPDGLTRMDMECLFFTAANCSVPKDVFWQLNGFDVDLTDAEDYEFACRALERGIPVYYDKQNKAIHNEQITCRSYIRRLREYSAAQEKLRMRHPDKVNKKSNFTAVKKMIYSFFAFSFWMRLVDSGLFAFVLPRLLRYRLYSLIIQALAYEHSEVKL